MADDLSRVLAERKAKLQELSDQMRAAIQARADQEVAQATAARDAKRAEMDRTQHDSVIALDAARARAASDIAAATASRDAASGKASADVAAANSKAASDKAAASGKASADIATANASLSAAQTAAARVVSDAEASRAATLAAADRQAATLTADAEAAKARKIAEAQAQLDAANARAAAVARDQALLAQRQAEATGGQLASGDQVSLLTYHGWYAARGSVSSYALKAVTDRSTLENRLVVTLTDGRGTGTALRYGDRVSLGSVGQYLQSAPDGSVNFNATAVGGWETWTLVNPVSPSSTGPVPRKGLVAFRSAFNLYLCAEDTSRMVANRGAIGAWETWTMERLEPIVPIVDLSGLNLNLNFGGGW